MKLNLFLILLAAASLSAINSTDAADKPNILFIAVDDLRPQLGCFGFESMHTPNIDRIAAAENIPGRAEVTVADLIYGFFTSGSMSRNTRLRPRAAWMPAPLGSPELWK